MPVAAADHSLFANSKWRDAVPPVHRQRTQCGRAGGGLRADIARQCTACAFKAACRRCRAIERTVSASSVHFKGPGALASSNQAPCPIITAGAGAQRGSSLKLMICFEFRHSDSSSA